MVPRWGWQLSRPRRRAIAALVLAAALVWWQASTEQVFYVVGLSEPFSTTLGPLLSAISAGVSVALVFSLVDVASGLVGGFVAVLLMLALPGFFAMHHDSLFGPPLLAITLLTLGVMIYAPMWSIAYGGLAAIGAVFVSPAGIGLPIGAIAWAAVMKGRDGNGVRRRTTFAALPLVIAFLLSRWTGDGWMGHGTEVAGMPGESFLSVLGSQLVPLPLEGSLGILIAILISLLAIESTVAGWNRLSAEQAVDATPRRFLMATGVLAAGVAAGLLIGGALVAGVPMPSVATLFPLIVLLELLVFGALVVGWSRRGDWSRVATAAAMAVWLTLNLV